MRGEELARKIVYNRRSKIYAIWKKELPLAFEIVTAFTDGPGLMAFLFDKDVYRAHGLCESMLKFEIYGWCINELEGRAILDDEYIKAMPGALRRARKFLIEALEKAGFSEKDLQRGYSVRNAISGQYAYRDSDPYGLRPRLDMREDNRAMVSFAVNSLRSGAREGLPLSQSRAHLSFAGIRRRLVAWYLGAGNGKVNDIGGKVVVTGDEGLAYSILGKYEAVDLKDPKHMALIEAGEAIIQKAIHEAIARKVQREDRAKVAERDAIARQNVAAVEPRPAWSIPTQVTHGYLMEPVTTANGWVATPDANYPSVIVAMSRILGQSEERLDSDVRALVASGLRTGDPIRGGRIRVPIPTGLPTGVTASREEPYSVSYATFTITRVARIYTATTGSSTNIDWVPNIVDERIRSAVSSLVYSYRSTHQEREDAEASVSPTELW